MVSAENGFQWGNEDTPYEEKSLLIDSLPEGFKYRVKKQKILEQSEIKEELKFKVEFEVNICDKEEALKFVQRIAAKNDTEMKPTRNERAFKGFVSQRFNCSRNLRTKEGKKSRQHGKSTNCPAFFTYKLYDCQKEEGIECFALKMKIEYVHNHEIQTTKAWSFLGVSKETVERYFQLFQDSYTPSKARLVYIAELKEKLGEEEFFKISSKRSINPPSGTVFDLFTKYSKKFGSANGPDSFVKSSEEIEKFNARAGEKIASIRQLKDGSVVVAVCDQLMKRTHVLVPQSADVMFVDATGSLDRCNHQVWQPPLGDIQRQN